MPMSIKVDEDLPREITSRLCQAGYDAKSVHDQGWVGLPDDELWPAVQAERRCLLTADKGFANAGIHLPGTHAGIVLFRLPRESRRGYIRLVDFLLARLDLADVQGAIVVVSPESIRIHRA